MAAATLEMFLEAKDNASGVFKNMRDVVSKGALAISGIGVGLEALARSQQESTIKVRQGAAALGISEKAYRGIATELSNVTFPLSDVTELMELAREEGLENTDAITLTIRL